MMLPGEASLGERARRALLDPFLRNAVRFTVDRLRNGKARGADALGAWEDYRERGKLVRSHVIEHLDFYLAQFADNVAARGQTVHFAADAQEATAIVLRIARDKAARVVAKSKSMVSEEIELNRQLEKHGIESVETDLGEWIVQLARETPSHLILPAIHKNRDQIGQLFENDGAEALSRDTAALARYARGRLRERFAEADIGITGCNFAIADTGSVVLFTNEGNGRMVTTLPRTHVVLMGMERIVPSFADLELMAELLPRSATGQKLTTYMNIITGARAADELDGAEELHVVILDNGRSRQLGDPEFREVLNCIRCGACLNVCPVYRQIGGHAYASVYSGPIGAVLTPLLEPTDARASELANASSLCGACFEACPVKIPLHDMLVGLRRKNAERAPPLARERIAYGVFGFVTGNPRVYRMATWVGRRLLSWMRRHRPQWLARLPVLQHWARNRALPVLQSRSFRDEWRKLSNDSPQPRERGSLTPPSP